MFPRMPGEVTPAVKIVATLMLLSVSITYDNIYLYFHIILDIAASFLLCCVFFPALHSKVHNESWVSSVPSNHHQLLILWAQCHGCNLDSLLNCCMLPFCAVPFCFCFCFHFLTSWPLVMGKVLRAPYIWKKNLKKNLKTVEKVPLKCLPSKWDVF